MAEIKIMDDGRLAAKGIQLLDGEGKPMKTKEQVYLCRCGLSDNKPFCDGAHANRFESKIRA